MSAALCQEAMGELSTRTVKGFNLKRAVDHLIEAAKSGVPTDFKKLAIASGVFDESKQKWGNWRLALCSLIVSAFIAFTIDCRNSPPCWEMLGVRQPTECAPDF
jgi:hypothetical protein